jgi:hypothetical protein
LINHDAKPIIIAALLIVIVRIGQENCRFLFGLYRRLVLCNSISTTKLRFSNLTYKTKISWCSVDTQGERIVEMSDRLCLLIMRANRFETHHNEHVSYWIRDVQFQNTLTLCSCSFPELGKQGVGCCLAYKDSLNLIYEWLQLITTQVNHDTKTKIVATPLIPILRMWQGGFYFLFCL